MNRPIATALPPLADLLVFCALLGAGSTLQISNVFALLAAVAVQRLSSPTPRLTPRPLLQVLLCLVLAMSLRGGLLSTLTLRLGVPAQLSILPAILASSLMLNWDWVAGSSIVTAPDADRRWAVCVIAYSIALRLAYAGSIELLPEETYYWNYAQHLDFGYLDHPPMVAWLISAGTTLFGQSEFGVRIGAICCGAATSWFVFKLTRNVFGAPSALAAVVLVQVLPFFFLAGMLMTPDAPLTAAWAASLYFFERALMAGDAKAWWRAGFCTGLGLISKYTIVLLGPVVLAVLIFHRPSRRWLRSTGPYVAVLVALLVFSPVIVWNAEHGWASFAFQTSRRLAEAPRFALHKLIAAALILITPVGVVALIGALRQRASAISSYRFLLWTMAAPLGVFFLFSVRHEVKLDWLGAPFTAALPLIAVGMTTLPSATGIDAWARHAWPKTIAVLLLTFGSVFYYLALGLPGVGYAAHIELVPVGWRDLSRQVVDAAASFHRETGSDAVIVGMDRYATASELAFYGQRLLHKPVETSSDHLFGGIGLMYERWTPPSALAGRTLLLVAGDPAELSGPAVTSRVGHLGSLETDVLMRDGIEVRRYYHRLAYDYQTVAND